MRLVFLTALLVLAATAGALAQSASALDGGGYCDVEYRSCASDGDATGDSTPGTPMPTFPLSGSLDELQMHAMLNGGSMGCTSIGWNERQCIMSFMYRHGYYFCHWHLDWWIFGHWSCTRSRVE